MAGNNKKIIEFDRLIALADNVLCYCVLGGVDYHFYLSDLFTYISTGINPEAIQICPPNDFTHINIGAYATYKRFEIQYLIKRGSNRYRAGSLIVLANGSDVIPEPLIAPYATLPNTEDETTGVTFESNAYSGQVRLKVIVDDSDANNVEFTYILKAI